MVRWSIGLLDFLGVSHITGTNITDWARRTSALPIVTCGPAPVFATDAEALEAITTRFEPRTHAYVPQSVRQECAATDAGEYGLDSLRSLLNESRVLSSAINRRSLSWRNPTTGIGKPPFMAPLDFCGEQTTRSRQCKSRRAGTSLSLNTATDISFLGVAITAAGLVMCLVVWRRKRDLPVRVL